jgi:DNA-binding NtrC family response regulator
VADKILIVDDETLIRWALRKELEREGYEIFEAGTAKDAKEIFFEELPDLVILDVKLPDDSGMNLLKKIKESETFCDVIIITAFGNVSNAVEAMKLNAIDYITKPFDIEEVKIVVKKALETRTLKRHVESVYRRERERFSFNNVIGVSNAMQEVIATAKKVSESQARTILIEGESGTGKDLLARAIHFSSPRRFYPFMEINCASIPETLIESELFGHEKGAFTDAKSMKKGLFELADGGTVFLDEITEMSLSAQAKFLKVIETQSFKRLGGVKDIYVDLRVISATNRRIEKALEEGKLREDLYYRLSIIRIYIPPLRERKEDIPYLINYFIENFNRDFKKKVKGIHPSALKMMMEYDWPGNVRELKNVVERAVILESEDEILPEHISLPVSHRGEESAKISRSSVEIEIPEEGISLEEVEKLYIMKALEKAKGNKTLAAKLLGITRDTLRYRLKKYGVEDDGE